MGGEFMDEYTEVKKKRRWWVKTVIWLAAGAVIIAAAVLGAATGYDAYTRHEARKLAELPARERNLAVFDAAREALEGHYYDPEVFTSDDWRAYVTHWRAKAEAEPAALLYTNVLGNFGAGFLDSHVSFEAPEAAPSSLAPSAPPSGMTTSPDDDPAAWKQRFDIFLSGPGFEAARIRRGRLTTVVVDEVRRGSAADRAGIMPGWAMPFSSTNLNKHGVRFTGTFLELSGEDAFILERTGLPRGVDAAGPGDPYTLEHGVEYEYEPDLSPPRDDFEMRRLAGNVTYLRFDRFHGGDIMSRTFDAIEAAGPEGLVIDLRRNSGGVMLQLQRFLGRLLGNDVDIGSLRAGTARTRMRTWRWGAIYRGPVVLLIGPSSMSAAEIAAAALQDHQRGMLVGRMTNGSVLNSRKYPLPDGGMIMVPVKDYYRVDQRRIEGVGVEPDVHVMPTLEEVRAGRDAALERALELLPALKTRQSRSLAPGRVSSRAESTRTR
jgi:hypothetical protein